MPKPSLEELEKGLEESWSVTDIEPQVNLVNLIFTLYDVELFQFEDNEEADKEDDKGNRQREAYIGSVCIQGEEIERRYWLGGKTMNQVRYLESVDAFPVVVKLLKDTDRKGHPYKLTFVKTMEPWPRPTVKAQSTSLKEAAPTTPDTGIMPAEIDVGGLFDEAVLLSSDGEAGVVGVLSDLGLDEIMEMDAKGSVTIKSTMSLGHRVKAIKALNEIIKALNEIIKAGRSPA